MNKLFSYLGNMSPGVSLSPTTPSMQLIRGITTTTTSQITIFTCSLIHLNLVENITGVVMAESCHLVPLKSFLDYKQEFNFLQLSCPSPHNYLGYLQIDEKSACKEGFNPILPIFLCVPLKDLSQPRTLSNIEVTSVGFLNYRNDLKIENIVKHQRASQRKEHSIIFSVDALVFEGQRWANTSEKKS